MTIYNFYTHTIKTDLWNMSESGSLDEKKPEQNCLKVPKAPVKKHCIYWKTKNTSRFYIVKISVPTNFMCLR